MFMYFNFIIYDGDVFKEFFLKVIYVIVDFKCEKVGS